MHSSDESRPRPPLFVPVVIAAVFLAVIGGSVGLVLGKRAQARQPAASSAEQPPGQSSDQTSGQNSGPTSGQATDQPSSPIVSGPRPRTGEPCRAETQAQAQQAGALGTLRVVLSLRTATSLVWICGDTVGRLFYHANRRSPDNAWIEGKTALFLPGVSADGDVYQVASVDGQGRKTVFEVSTDRLVIQHGGGRLEEQVSVAD